MLPSANPELNIELPKGRKCVGKLATTKCLKELVSPDILAASLKNLELAQVGYLLKKEISTLGLRSNLAIPNGFDLSNAMIRICFYQESAINLACSIVDISAAITRKMLLFEDGMDPNSSKFKVRQGWFEAQIMSGELSDFDPVIARFFAQNMAEFEKLFTWRQKELYETSLIVNSIDISNPVKARLQLFASAFEAKKKIESVTILVQEFLRFMDGHLKAMLESK